MKKKAVVIVLLFGLLLFAAPAAAQVTRGGIVRIVGDIAIPQGERVDGDVVSIIGNVDVNGEVTGDVVSIVGKITIGESGKVFGDAISIIGGLELSPGSRVLGNQFSLIGKGVNLNIEHWNISRIRWWPRGIFRSPFWRSFGLAIGVLISTLIALAFPVPVQRMGDALQHNPARMLLMGILGWIVGALLAIALLITIIGPVFMIVALVAANWFGRAAVAMIFGSAVLKNRENLPASTALGALMLGALGLIPSVGGLIRLIISVIALGAVLVTRFGTQG